jgi:hypothetical protein
LNFLDRLPKKKLKCQIS